MKVYVLICPASGKYLKNTMSRYSDKYELTDSLEESFNNGDHHIPVSLKNSNGSLENFRLGIRHKEPEMDEGKKRFIKQTAFRGALSLPKRRLIKRGR